MGSTHSLRITARQRCLGSVVGSVMITELNGVVQVRVSTAPGLACQSANPKAMGLIPIQANSFFSVWFSLPRGSLRFSFSNITIIMCLVSKLLTSCSNCSNDVNLWSRGCCWHTYPPRNICIRILVLQHTELQLWSKPNFDRSNEVQPTSTRCPPKRPNSCTPWNDSVVLSLKRL